MSNPNFTIAVDQKVKSQSSQKLNSQSVSANSISANSIKTSLFNTNCMNGFNLVQQYAYTPNSFKSTTNFNGWLYTVPSYNPVSAGSADLNFFLLPPYGSVIIGISAANLSPDNVFNATSFSVGYDVYSESPSPTLLLDTVLAASVNSYGGVAAGNSICDMPQESAALGSAGSTLSVGYIAGYNAGYNAGAASGMYLTVVGTTLAQEAIVFKITSLTPSF
jgi:hypothetical protein